MIGASFSAAARRNQSWWPEGAILAADFLNGRYMRDKAEIGFASAFAFERAGPASMQDGMGNRIIFPPATPRILHQIGALIEPGGTNLSRSTENIGSSTGWTSGHVAHLDITGNDADGFTLSMKVGETGGFRFVEQSGNFSIAANEWGYFSFDLHDSGMRGAAVWFSSFSYWADFDTETGIANGQAPSGNGEAQASMEPIGGGWWRCNVRIRQISNSIFARRIKLGKTRAATNYTAGNFIRIRAPQIELDRFSSYIPNTSGSASSSRPADLLSPLLPVQLYTIALTYTDGTKQEIAWTAGNPINADALHGKPLAGMAVFPR